MRRSSRDEAKLDVAAVTPGRSGFGIRSRLALSTMVLALPLAGYLAYSSIEEARVEHDRLTARMLGHAQVTAARLDDRINGIRALLQVVGSSVSVDPAQAEGNDAFLRTLAGSVPAYIDNLTVWTPSGDNIGSLDTRLHSHGANNSAKRSFLRNAIAFRGSEVSVDAPVVSSADGSLTSVFGLPVRRDGHVVGVVTAEVRLGSLQELLRTSADLPSSAVVTVTNVRGTFLVNSIDPDSSNGKSVVGFIAESGGETSKGPDGARDGTGADLMSRIAGFATSRAAPWRVDVRMPEDEALAPLHGRLRSHLLTACLMLLAGFLMARSAGQGIGSPFRKLRRGAGELGSEHLAHPSGSGSGEVHILAGTVTEMTEQLHERTSALLRSKEQLQQMMNNLPALVSYVDKEERIRLVNDAHEAWLGHDPSQLIGKSLVELYGVLTYDSFKAIIPPALQGARATHECQLTTLEGSRHVEVTAVPDFDECGRAHGLFLMIVDITARHEADFALAQSEHRVRLLADNLPALVTYVDCQQRYRFVNAHLGVVFGIDPGSLVGRTVLETNGRKLYAEIEPHITAALRGEKATFDGTWAIKDRQYHYQSTYIPDIDGRGAVRGYYELTVDISDLKEKQRELDMLARVDSLTGLPNRRQFEECLDDAMARTRRSENLMALMFLDIDLFKSINDTLGHAAGDLVLKEFARRLQEQVRSTDVVARLAGDEFVVLVEGIRDLETLNALAGRIVVSLRSPISTMPQPVSVTASMGISLYGGGESNPGELLAAADEALYAAKRHGRNRFSVAGQGLASIVDLSAVRDRPAGDLAA